MDISEAKLQQVWERAKEVYGYDATKYRQDFAGAWIAYDEYGKQTDFGWNIDHKLPHAKGGTDALNNLWPLHWRNNMAKGDNYPNFTTIVSSNDRTNIVKKQNW